MSNSAKDKYIAAAVTALICVAILLTLFFSSISWEKEAIAQASLPEVAAEEPLFIEPEILEEPGEELPDITDAPEAPADKGEPESAPEENRKIEAPGKNVEPKAPNVEKPLSQKKESPVKVTEPKKNNKDFKRATDPTAGKFSGKNGVKDGKNRGEGTGNKGIAAASGSVRGRNFKGTRGFRPSVNQKYTVTVAVTVTDEGKVKYARVSKSGGAPAELQQQCVNDAYTAKWDARPGVPDANGTITFSVKPAL
ncbi:MAG: hypothetical protein NC201_00485 [Prevotella sp.]|nr:hypothetical protein [Bacteroides sp.]MCM1365705.1 hypothetical protein [Prevotella sp.]MCM1436375.1 hypothetical protein [Prevotella sp.]